MINTKKLQFILKSRKYLIVTKTIQYWRQFGFMYRYPLTSSDPGFQTCENDREYN